MFLSCSKLNWAIVLAKLCCYWGKHPRLFQACEFMYYGGGTHQNQTYVNWHTAINQKIYCKWSYCFSWNIGATKTSVRIYRCFSKNRYSDTHTQKRSGFSTWIGGSYPLNNVLRSLQRATQRLKQDCDQMPPLLSNRTQWFSVSHQALFIIKGYLLCTYWAVQFSWSGWVLKSCTSAYHAGLTCRDYLMQQQYCPGWQCPHCEAL